MAGCKNENWTLSELADALQNKSKDGEKIVIPMFQRGKRWNNEQEKIFIDSVKEGYPVGSMLFYEKFENNKPIYTLVDGLQRSNTIKKYILNPTDYLEMDDFSAEYCAELLAVIGRDSVDNISKLKKILIDFSNDKGTFKNLQFYEPAKEIADEFELTNPDISKMIEIIQKIFEERQDLYDRIANSTIPVTVYTGDEDNLPIIFERINSKGTALTQYEIYAASWPIEEKYQIDNAEIINYNVIKYDDFTNDGYEIENFDPNNIRIEKKLNAFDYLFGLSKYLVDKYEILAFGRNLGDDEVNPFGFELVNACFNDGDKIKILYKTLQTIDINSFEKDLIEAIKVVENAIKPITQFKGNKRSSIFNMHSKFQIMSMISTTFRKMYDKNDLTKQRAEWKENIKNWSNQLLLYYVYDIITNYWSDGGTKKIFQVSMNDRYSQPIPNNMWNTALDGVYNSSMQRLENGNKKASAPKNEDYAILNCIYLKTFTAMDTLSLEKFDVEHIAPKDQMYELIKANNGAGLPISSIANLCYLPEKANRVKHAKNFYQDKKYLAHIDLEEVEEKYSFTEREDLNWMDVYASTKDFEGLKDAYVKYCDERFKNMKKRFCESLNIEFEEINHSINNIVAIDSSNNDKYTDFALESFTKSKNLTNNTFVKTKRRQWISTDGKIGLSIFASKLYKQGAKNKYWYSFNDNDFMFIDNCEEQYAIFIEKDEMKVLAIPVKELLEKKENLNFSTNDEGNPDHWHLVFFNYQDGSATWLLSKPENREIDIKDLFI